MREFKVGDRVNEEIWGNGIVTEVRIMGNYPVIVKFDNLNLGDKSFTEQGRYLTHHPTTLVHLEPTPAPRKPYAIPATASQEDKVLAHLFHVGSISPIEAQDLCGSMCLAQRIYNLKIRYGIHFVKTMEPHTLPNGHKGFHTRYSLPESVPYEFQRRAWDLVGVTF